MPPRNIPRGRSSAGRTPGARGGIQRRREEAITPNFTPQRTLNFDNLESFSPGNISFSAEKVKKLDVKVYIISRHLAIVIPAYGTDGWVANLQDGIVLSKSAGMRGFKLAPGVAAGDNRFGYLELVPRVSHSATFVQCCLVWLHLWLPIFCIDVIGCPPLPGTLSTKVDRRGHRMHAMQPSLPA
eukprot:COSAG01_NODE_16369_length_1242_cov_1.179353_1_plen_184_part_00